MKPLGVTSLGSVGLGAVDPAAVQELLQWTRFNGNVSMANLQIELLRLWSEELAKPRHADHKRLLRYGFKVYSQNDEDGIIQEIFKRIGTTNRTFVEFGVETGVECNTTKLLAEGWRGLWIESVQRYAVEIRKTFADKLGDGRLRITEGMVTAENINALLAEKGITGEIDLLSVDIDNNDYWVWKAITTINPRVVVIEYNAALRPPMSLVVPYDPVRAWDGSNFFGASLEALVRLGRDKGYSIVGCSFSGVNAFFVRSDVAGDHFLQPATAEEHYEPARYFFSKIPSGHPGRPGPYVSV
jgi:hypothetical protein